MTQETTTWLLQQGVLGFTTLMLLLVVVFMWRDRQRIETKYEKMLADERAKHEVELAAERKSHLDTQELRIKALEEGWRLSSEVKETLKNTLVFVQRTAAS